MCCPFQSLMKGITNLVFFIIYLAFFKTALSDGAAKQAVDVGVVLDLGTREGRTAYRCIATAVDDFYAAHRDYKTRLVLHKRDSKQNNIDAASAALDLINNTRAQAIIGPQSSAQAVFITDLGKKYKVPIISSSATCPSLSPAHNPYFIRTAPDDSSQVRAIAALVRNFGWHKVVPIYVSSDYGLGIIPSLVDALQDVGTDVPYRCVIPPSATDEDILGKIYELQRNQTRVFIVHLPHALRFRLFSKAPQAGMMSAGYAWITTYMPTSDFDFIDPPTLKAMQGVLAMTPYVPRSKALDNFTARWNATSLVETEPRAFGLWAYDTVWALAMAAEKAKHGLALLEAIKNTKFYGISGYFRLINGQLQPLGFQYINVVGSPQKIGFWRPTPTDGNATFYYRHVTWPGGSTDTPRGWEIPPLKGEKLRVGVPKRTGFDQFVRVNGKHNVTGYSIDVFNSVMARLPYDMPYTFVLFEDSEGNISGTYDDLTYHVYLRAYDAVVGDVTIIANRSLYVDFTQPYTDSGVSMVVPVQRGEDGNSWSFLKPLSVDLWCASMALFVFTGIIVWVIEHRINNEFRGSPVHQLGLIFYYSFSTLVFAHRERLESNLSKFAVFTWVFVVFVLNSNYTASLTSMLTAQQLQPTVTDVADLLKHGDFVGYQEGSFVLELLKGLGFNKAKIKSYRTPDEYAEALSRGSHNGGVAAIFDEIPYLRFFLRKYCDEYTMIGSTYRTDGFGFVFPKGSPLVADVSRAILNVREGNWMVEIEKKWLGDQNSCLNHGSISRSNSLSFASFWGLFLVTGVTSTSALIIYIIQFLYYSRYELDASAWEGSILRKLVSLAKHFNQRDDFKRHRSASTATVMPTTSCAETVQNSPDARVSESHSFDHLYERFNQQARSPREI